MTTCLAPGQIVAQRAPAGFGRLSVQVIDSSTGNPLLRVALFSVRADPRVRDGTVYSDYADTTGELRQDSIPAGVAHHYSVSCETMSPAGKLLDSATFSLSAGQRRQWVIRASSAGCDQRPFLVRRGVFTGFWRSNRNLSLFIPCDKTLPQAWADVEQRALDSPAAEWPVDLDETSAAYVRWEGVLVGPWHYGFNGASDYLVSIRRILELRGPTGRDCSS